MRQVSPGQVGGEQVEGEAEHAAHADLEMTRFCRLVTSEVLGVPEDASDNEGRDAMTRAVDQFRRLGAGRLEPPVTPKELDVWDVVGQRLAVWLANNPDRGA